MFQLELRGKLLLHYKRKLYHCSSNLIYGHVQCKGNVSLAMPCCHDTTVCPMQEPGCKVKGQGHILL